MTNWKPIESAPRDKRILICTAPNESGEREVYAAQFKRLSAKEAVYAWVIAVYHDERKERRVLLGMEPEFWVALPDAPPVKKVRSEKS